MTIAEHCRSMLTEKLQTFRVLMSCGHIEDRLMRAATAGIAWSPTATVDNSHGAACTHCDRSKQGWHRPETCPVYPCNDADAAFALDQSRRHAAQSFEASRGISLDVHQIAGATTAEQARIAAILSVRCYRYSESLDATA